MLAYLAVFFVLFMTALSVQGRGQRTFVLVFAIFLLWFMGARNEVGCDWGGYYHRFLITSVSQPISVMLTEFDEPGFLILMKFVRENDLGYMWLNMIATIIMVTCFAVFCRAHRDSMMILTLLFPVIIVQLSMSGIRQGIGTGFLMVATVAWMRGSKLWTAIWIGFGSLFHTSVIMFLPIAALAGRRVTGKLLFGSVAILGPVAVAALGDRFDTYSGRYIENSDITSGGALIRYVLLLFPAVFFFGYRKRLESAYSESYELMRLATAITVALIPVAVFSTILLHRMIYYVMPLSIVTFVALGRVAFPRMNRGFVYSLPALVYGAYMVAWFASSKHANWCYVPYKNFWSVF